MLRIRHHRLEGPGVTHRETPNRGGVLQPRFLVFHYTAGRSAESSADALCTRRPQGNASAHLVLARDGRIIQLAPFNVVTWHAGVSHWGGYSGLNQHSIGIEMDNAGLLTAVGERFVAWFGMACPADEVVMAAHRHGGGTRPWHAYPQVQIERAVALADLLCETYGLTEVLGHEDIARGRKVDPGPAFPLAAIAARWQGRDQDEFPVYEVTASALNIRIGPGAEHAPVAAALRRGTRLHVLEPAERWSRVAVVGSGDLEGWVSSQWIAPAPAGAGAASGTRSAASRSTLPDGACEDTGENASDAVLAAPSVAGRRSGRPPVPRRRSAATPEPSPAPPDQPVPAAQSPASEGSASDPPAAVVRRRGGATSGGRPPGPRTRSR